jgi:hypothetical protein
MRVSQPGRMARVAASAQQPAIGRVEQWSATTIPPAILPVSSAAPSWTRIDSSALLCQAIGPVDLCPG